ncbi:hypothetical protein [Phreatobacter cathodiphilus]|uniref:hypothetical protein n=1 Tax=Phreatobacter cathodiphilus TaxID=1868589 RepID=UPI0011B286EF|nr:hypothetical protein [Phreatobacter cathodiphilus]
MKHHAHLNGNTQFIAPNEMNAKQASTAVALNASEVEMVGPEGPREACSFNRADNVAISGFRGVFLPSV